MSNARLLFVHALSPLHAGTGQGVGVIDLPIAREVATGLPFLPGSSVKGTLRDYCTTLIAQQQMPEPTCTMLFGPRNPAEPNEAQAGSVQFADQRLLLLPIRSLQGTFAWVTSPYLLRRFSREAREVRTDVPSPIPQLANADEEKCLVVEGDCALCPAGAGARPVYLEDLDLQATGTAAATAWAIWLAGCLFPATGADGTVIQDAADWQTFFQARFCIVHDDVLTFLLDTATEVQARVQLDENSKTVRKGGLWYEEALPAETVLAGLVVATPVQQKTDGGGRWTKKNGGWVPPTSEIFRAVGQLAGRPMQFGGKSTVGRGLCRTVLGADQEA